MPRFLQRSAFQSSRAFLLLLFLLLLVLHLQFLQLAASNGLVPTGGSDFHGAMSPGVSLGTGMGGLNVPDETIDALWARREQARSDG